MLRMLLISGDTLRSETTLRRKVLRFTGSRRATRVILGRIESARELGRVVSCLVRPAPRSGESDYGDETGWDVRVSYASGLTARGAS
jgi:hypothetical protein